MHDVGVAQSRAFRERVSEVVCEADLHNQIIAECRRLGWLWIHARMDKASHMTVGAPDFMILAEGGRVLLVECKRRDGKLRPEQLAFKAWAAKLGHTVHVVRSLEEFCAVEKIALESNTLRQSSSHE